MQRQPRSQSGRSRPRRRDDDVQDEESNAYRAVCLVRAIVDDLKMFGDGKMKVLLLVDDLFGGGLSMLMVDGGCRKEGQEVGRDSICRAGGASE